MMRDGGGMAQGRRFFTLLGMFLLLSALLTSPAWAYDAEVYYPLDPQQWSTFLLPDSPSETDLVLPNQVLVNGIETSVIVTSGGENDGWRAYETSDVAGCFPE
jgi:hypothetical protein